MNNFQFADRRVPLLGYALFALLIFMAVAFYLERTIMPDVSYITMMILKEDHLQIQNNRFGSAITQLFPLLASRAEMPLQDTLIVYSVAFPVVYFSWFLVALLLLRNELYGMVMALGAVLMVSDTFYWVQSEYIQGTFFLLLFFAFACKYPQASWATWWKWPLAAGGIVTCMYFHPLMVLPFAGMWSYWVLHHKDYRNPYFLGLLPLALAVYFSKPLFVATNAYDQEASKLVHNVWEYFPNYFGLKSTQDFFKWCTWDYYLFPLLLAGVSYFYISKRKWAKLAWLWTFTVGHILFINACYFWGSPKLYLESLYFPVGATLALPLLHEALPQTPAWAAKTFGWIAVMLLLRAGSIFVRHYHYSNRLEWHRGMLEKSQALGANRLLINESDVPMESIHYTWGMSCESLLLSSLHHPDSARTWFANPDPHGIAAQTHPNTVIVLPWVNYMPQDLPERYFRMRPGEIKEL